METKNPCRYGWEGWQSTVTMDSFPEPFGRAVLASWLLFDEHQFSVKLSLKPGSTHAECMILEFSMEKVWHPSKEKSDLRAGTANCLSPANAEPTFDSLCLTWIKQKSSELVGYHWQKLPSSLSQRRLKASLPKLPCPSQKTILHKQHANSSRQDQSSGTSPWIISTVRDKTTALGQQQQALVAENNEEKVLPALGTCNRAFHKLI